MPNQCQIKSQISWNDHIRLSHYLKPMFILECSTFIVKCPIIITWWFLELSFAIKLQRSNFDLGSFMAAWRYSLQYHCCRQLAEHRYLHQQFQQQVGLSSVLEAMLVAVAVAVYRQLALVPSLVEFGHWQFSVGHSASSGISFVSDIWLLPGSNVFWPVSH